MASLFFMWKREPNAKIILMYLDAMLNRAYISTGHYCALVWIRERVLRRMAEEKGGAETPP